MRLKKRQWGWAGLVAVACTIGCNNSTEVPMVKFPDAAKTPPPSPPSAADKAANSKAGVSTGDPSVDTR